MRKSGWTVAAGLGSLVLLLTACGGSSSSTSAAGAATGAASSAATQSTASSSTSTGSTSSSSSSSSSANASATHTSAAPKHTAGPQPSSNDVTFPPVGTTVLIVEHSSVGWVMAKADGYVVYTYSKDSKGGPPTCTGSCASAWAPVTGTPKSGPADTFPGTFGLVTGSGGKKVITYNGYPLYTFVGAPPLSTKGNGVGGEWHVIVLSESDISGT